jgi:hypothetical protein
VVGRRQGGPRLLHQDQPQKPRCVRRCNPSPGPRQPRRPRLHSPAHAGRGGGDTGEAEAGGGGEGSGQDDEEREEQAQQARVVLQQVRRDHRSRRVRKVPPQLRCGKRCHCVGHARTSRGKSHRICIEKGDSRAEAARRRSAVIAKRRALVPGPCAIPGACWSVGSSG